MSFDGKKKPLFDDKNKASKTAKGASFDMFLQIVQTKPMKN